MYQTGLVLEQFVDALDDVPFPQHDFVPHRHELVPHVGLQSVYEVDALIEEHLEKALADISSVCEDLPVKFPGKHVPHPSVPIVHICTCKTKSYYFSRVIADKVQLESVTPSHGPLSVLGQTAEYLVEITAYIIAYGNHRAVNVSYPRAGTEGGKLHEEHHLEEHPRHQLHKTVVGNRLGKETSHPLPHAAKIILLERAVRAELVADKDRHDFAVGQLALPVAATVPRPVRRGQLQVFLQLNI